MVEKHPEGLVRAWKEGRAWRFAAFIFAGFSLILLLAVLYEAQHSPTTLIPYGLAMATGPVKVTPGGHNNGKYLAYVGQADLSLLLDWTPDTVKDQYDRFMNRMAPSLYAAEQAKLLGAAIVNKKNDITEAFYAKNVSFSGHKVKITGLLNQWSGSALISSHPAVYSLTYAFTDGTPYVTSLSSK